MRWIRAILFVFSTYTRIPMPQVKWDDDAMAPAIAFFPAIGYVIGGVIWCWQHICLKLGLSAVIFAAVAVALPILITGGIHMDGYCDTSDALASGQDKERCLEIMKDPHAGAFALIRLSVYLLLSFSLLYELFLRREAAGICFIYALSRCLTAFNVMTMPNARKGGMLAAVTKYIDKRMAGMLLALLSLVSTVGLLWVAPASGAAALMLCLPVTLWYRRMAIKRFGGATGDTTGFFLQTIELTLLAGLLVGGVSGAWA